MKIDKMMLNNIVLGELKDGKLPINSFTARFDKEILLDIQYKLNNKICLTFLEFFTVIDILRFDVEVALQIRDKEMTVKSNEVMIPTNEMDWFIAQHNPLFVNSSGLTVPELYSVVKDFKIKIEKL